VSRPVKLLGIWVVDCASAAIALLSVPWVLLADLKSDAGVPAFAAQPG
jgi:hypothetical protein